MEESGGGWRRVGQEMDGQQGTGGPNISGEEGWVEWVELGRQSGDEEREEGASHWR